MGSIEMGSIEMGKDLVGLSLNSSNRTFQKPTAS